MNRYLSQCLDSASIIQLIPGYSYSSGLAVSSVVFTAPDTFTVVGAALTAPAEAIEFDLVLPPCTVSYSPDLYADQLIQYGVLALPSLMVMISIVFIYKISARLL